MTLQAPASTQDLALPAVGRDCCSDVRGSEHHCARRHRSFTGLTLFDAHQDVDYTRSPAVMCLEPSTLGLGLAQDARGTWGTPAGLCARERSASALARARSARGQTP